MRSFLECDAMYDKARYEELKRAGVCTRCAKREAEPGQTMCIECEAKNRQKTARRYNSDEAYREKQSARMRERKARFRAEGLCLDCGGRRWNGSSYCREHYIQRRLRVENKPRKYWKESGLCIRCGAERKEGYQYCESCYADVCRAGRTGAAARKKKAMEG